MRKRRVIVGLAVLAAVLLVARGVLPPVVRSYVNASLAEMGDYSGHVADVDISLVRGAYTLNGLRVVKRDAAGNTPFLDLPIMDISLDWSALFAGELVGEIHANSPVLNLIQAESDDDRQLGTGVNWPDQVRELFPFRFNRVEVTDGTIDFLAPGIDSEDALQLVEVGLSLTDLTNVAEDNVDAFSGLDFHGRFMGTAPLEVRGQIDPNKDVPTFDLDFSLDQADITAVNPWMERFINVDAEAGRFSLYAEFAAAEGRFTGYVRPIIEDAEIYQAGEEAAGPLRRAWEVFVDFARNIFENQETDQVATQIPLDGEIDDPEADTLVAIVNVLRNAFVAAFSHAIERSVSLRDVDPDARPDPDTQPE